MLRYGIIGAGMMGSEHIRNIALLDDAVVSAISDPNSDVGNRAAIQSRELFGDLPQVFLHHRELIESGLCDLLVVAAPNHTHHAIMGDLVKTDLPVLCEKPVGINDAECLNMLGWARERKAPIWVAMEYRYMPPMARLIEDVHSGRVGRPVMLSIREHRFPFLEKAGNWNRFTENTGGTLTEKCCHFFDLMRTILRSMPTRIFASGGVNVNHLDERYDGRKPDILDNAYVVLDFESGARAMLDLSMFAEASHWQEIVTVTGSDAQMAAFIPGPARFSHDGKERYAEVRFGDRRTKTETRQVIEVDQTILSAGDHHGSTFFQHRKFQEMVLNGGEPEVSLLDGAIAVVVGAAGEESVRIGEAVDLRPRLEAFLTHA